MGSFRGLPNHARWRMGVGQVIQVRSFSVVEPHDGRERIKHLLRRSPGLILLDPRVVPDTDAGQKGQLFTTQTRHPSGRAARVKADRCWIGLVTPRLQEAAQCLAFHVSESSPSRDRGVGAKVSLSGAPSERPRTRASGRPTASLPMRPGARTRPARQGWVHLSRIPTRVVPTAASTQDCGLVVPYSVFYI